ncbi:hypothetical protein ACFCX6_00340 [Streptomyces sp. NPDC056353]|uniref:hypothetical protein n=1 Tax=Streptomyces sp. NPDC056353 TaxID=3345792 RepID=UPI0035E00017
MMAATPDFRALGASSAFPNKLFSSWGACLVEPPSIGSLRRKAGNKIVRLGQLAPPKSGIPTRVVGYFCVEEITDTAVVTRMGLRSQRDRSRLCVIRDGRGAVHLIERSALKPMVRRPGVLEGKISVSVDDTSPWFMLYLDQTADELEELRWAHTLAYIKYGEVQDFPAREGSRRAGGVPAERPQVRVRPIWFQVPRIPTGPGRVCWLKGRGDRHYAPTLSADILIPDNFLYSAPPPSLTVPESFAAVANLTWTNLMAEVYGRRGGGDGVLHTYIRELSQMPLLDPTLLTRTQAEDLVALFSEVASRSALATDEELRRPDRQALDAWAMRYLFGEDADAAGRAVERALRDLVMERTQRTVSGREQQQKAVRRTVFDPAPLASRVLMDCGVQPKFSEFLPEDFGPSVEVDVPAHEDSPARLGDSLMDQGDVLVGDRALITGLDDGHAAAVVALLTAEPRFSGSVQLPLAEDIAQEAVDKWSRRWSEWKAGVEKAIREVLPKAVQAQRRSLVARELEERAGLLPRTLVVE